MSESLFITKNAHGKNRLGLIPMLFICVGLGILMFYISFRYMNVGEDTKAAKQTGIESDLSPITESTKSFRPIEVRDPVDPNLVSARGTTRTQRLDRRDVRPQQTVLDTSGLTLGEFASTETVEQRPVIEEDMSAFTTLFRQTGFRESGTVQIQQADDGSEYLRSRSGIFTAFAEPGTELTGPDNAPYIIGDDNLLYRIRPNGTREKETRILPGFFRDGDDRFYRITRTGQLRLITPGGPGAFVGPNGINYRITNDGVIEELRQDGSTRAVSNVSGEGEFVGSDMQQYAVLNGILFKPSSKNVSFGADILTGTGLFSDPSGRTKIIGDDGLIYRRNTDGSLTLANIEGEGTFIGPDGTVYNVDDFGNVTRISRGFEERVVVTEDTTTGERRTGTGLMGNSRAGENLLVMNGHIDDESQNKLKSLLTGKNVFSAPTPSQPRDRSKIGPEDVLGRLIPIGQRIPFYTLTDITTQFQDGGGMVEAVVAENVYFQGAKIPAGSRMYGTYRGVGTHNRLSMTFNTILLTTGEQIKVSGFVYDPQMNPGIEAYFEPTAPWVIASRYANAALLIKISENQPRDSLTNQPIGDNSYMVDAIKQTQEDLEERYGQYYTVPRGTAGIFMLNQSVDLDDKLIGIASVDSFNIKQRNEEDEERGVRVERTLAIPVGNASSTVSSQRFGPTQPAQTESSFNNPNQPIFIGRESALTPDNNSDIINRGGAGADFLNN